MIKHAILIVVFLATPAFGVIIDDFSVGDITVEVDVTVSGRAIAP
jgi:hypothetical protein